MILVGLVEGMTKIMEADSISAKIYWRGFYDDINKREKCDKTNA